MFANMVKMKNKQFLKWNLKKNKSLMMELKN